MGNNPCYKKKKNINQPKTNDVVPVSTVYKARLSKSELNININTLNLKNFHHNRSFCPKFNFDHASVKEFKEFYTPTFVV